MFGFIVNAQILGSVMSRQIEYDNYCLKCIRQKLEPFSLDMWEMLNYKDSRLKPELRIIQGGKGA